MVVAKAHIADDRVPFQHAPGVVNGGAGGFCRDAGALILRAPDRPADLVFRPIARRPGADKPARGVVVV